MGRTCDPARLLGLTRGWDATPYSTRILHQVASSGSAAPACLPPPPHPQVHNIGDWWEARPDSPWLRMAERAIRKEWGTDPLLVREGGCGAETRCCAVLFNWHGSDGGESKLGVVGSHTVSVVCCTL